MAAGRAHHGHGAYGGHSGHDGHGGPGEPGRPPAAQSGGIPDGLLLGSIVFLLGLTGLVWTATGLAGLFAHGAWPDGVRFLRTPLAMRALAQQPHDLAAAWPDTPTEQLSGYGLFWGLFISELMVLIVLTVFVIGTVTRYRTVRARRRAGAGRGSGQASGTDGRQAEEGHKYVPRAGAPAGHPYGPEGGPVRPADGPRAPGGPGGSGGPGPGWPGQDATALARPGAPGPEAGTPTGSPPGWNGTPAGVPGHGADTAQGTQRGVHSGTADTGRTAGGPDPAERQAGRPADRTTAVTGQPGAPTAPYGPWNGDAGTAAPHHITEQRSSAWGGAVGPVGAGRTGAEPPVDPTAASAQPVPVPRGGPGFPGTAEVTHSRVLYGTQRGDAASQAVLEAVGPALVVTSDTALWTTTKDARAKFGPIHVFDPSHLLDTPARLRWNPAVGCESRDAAAARATALLAPVRPLHAVDRPMAEAAETMLRCWLHAAAVDDRPFRHVHRWAQGNSAHEPVRILRTHAKAAGGAAGELEAMLTAHPERRDMAQELTARALAALSSIHIRDACNPGRSDTLALESFIGEGGTLYVMGESIEDPRTHPGAMPLLTALASHVVEHGRRMAERSSSGRLDPPLTLVLDDVAAVAPLPQLPDLLTQGASQGLPTLALMRSQEQARARWPHRTLVG
ncbi:hypothetical protein [Streptomyces sp. ME19-01-6]|uniref:type IV secretory system conjugative DNA transfer family protein n=1 Tax=Streptomyces sp. ME19-01-6 TaxID=3028686 RepID=UPI0029BE551C|nr:hypothetical protein [Streptomyces sp. ME19-01-6]MDX3233746.1 hypothetical protein [Streptomyces sp. ME19-01-6]